MTELWNNYFLLNDGTKTCNPDDSFSTNLVHEKALAAEHGFTKGLSLVFADDILSAS